MTAVASEGVRGTRHQLRQRLRSTVLGPRGGGTTRRRASDPFRLALAVVVVLVSIPVMRANSAAGRPPADALAGLNTGYPVTQLAVAVAVAATALPYLSRPVHRAVSSLLTLAVLAGICGGQALPVNAISSVALGWGCLTPIPPAAPWCTCSARR